MHKLKLLSATIVLAVLTAGNAHAIFVTDLNVSDANSITGQDYLITIPELPYAYAVKEDYKERYRVPYPSHDGYGIVNEQGGFFDKVVDLEGETGWWTLTFSVTNTSPYDWSDYHFEFWTSDFSERLTDFPLAMSETVLPQGPYSNQIFEKSAFDGSILSFWSPDWQSPGETNVLRLTMNLDQVRDSYGTTFGIRQVATTIPEPGTLALLGFACWGLGFRTLRRPSQVRRVARV